MRKVNLSKCLSLVLTTIMIITSIVLLHSITLLEGIENTGRIIIILILLIIDLIFINETFRIIRNKKRNKKKHIGLFIFMILYIIINLVVCYFIKYIYGNINNMNKDKITYTTSLVTLIDNEINSLSDINNQQIGIIEDMSSIDGYILPNELISDKNLNIDLKYYTSYSALIEGLYNKEIEGMFITNNYVTMFENIEKYNKIATDTKIIATHQKTINKDEVVKDKNLLTEPFTVLIMGVDSHLEGINNTVANGDALILVTFNPNTLSATMLSIPRDSYVKQACFAGNVENKITHASWGGTECMIKTIENFIDINIDYYVKINFKGVVQLIDAIGGITVDVPKDLCTNDSDRNKDICISKGLQTLNGEEALVLARNRNDLANGDLDRGLNQQLVIQGVINSAKNINSLDEITNILNIVSNNIDTNLSTNQILSSYNILKKILLNAQSDELINLQKLYLNGQGQMIYDEGMGAVLWNYVLYPDSVNAVSETMKINLELIEPELITEFNYSIKDKYVQEVIGKNEYGESGRYDLFPDFSDYTQDEAISWIIRNGYSYEIEEVEDTENKYTEGQIIDQSIPGFKRIDKLTTSHVVLYISKDIEIPVENTEEPIENIETNDSQNIE